MSSASSNAPTVNASEEATSRWHKTLYSVRVPFSLLGALLFLSMWADGVETQRALPSAVIFLLWPHVWLLIGTLWLKRRRQAFLLNAVDGLLWVLIPATQWSLPLVNLGVTVLAINTIMTGGLGLLRKAMPFALIGLTCGALLFGLPDHVMAFSGRTWMLSALAVAIEGVLAASVANRAFQLLETTKSALATLNQELDQKVVERTASLAATNAAISRFVPVEFLHALGHDDVSTTKLGDVVERRITVLFADIRNFTSISEHYTPQQTFDFLNRCLSKIGPHIRAQSGFIDKYIGDAVMALFPDGAESAVRAALAMQREVRQFNLDHPSEVPLAVGIGIHQGAVMMGTIGEKERFEATVISDAVNLTARLEGLTKQLGCSILVSGDVAAELPEAMRDDSRLIGRFAVKGKRRPVEVHEIFEADEETFREGKRASQPRFLAAIACYQSGDAAGAAEELRHVAEAIPDDGPTNFWLSRLDQVIAKSRSHDALGVIALDQK
ncbi:MAG: adenylate/guanylate cyclase domain-containing protein [Polyangiaceae bacterium]|nr:adenylate/guanylate cyclase domain-containing protein [Polyangiaceae bacterium]MCB9605517.1 adenylate/guanylate cyclase domain-containing protein [Polyangiaceae bacterium]